MIVLDTTVLVYATGSDHRLREPCRSLIRSVARAELEATTTVEVIQEFVHVRARRRPRADACSLGRAYADLLEPLLPVTAQDLFQGLSLFRDIAGLGAFDAVLAATAIAAQADALVSADSAFAHVDDLVHVIPDAAGVAGLVTP